MRTLEPASLSPPKIHPLSAVNRRNLSPQLDMTAGVATASATAVLRVSTPLDPWKRHRLGFLAAAIHRIELSSSSIIHGLSLVPPIHGFA